MIRKKRHLEMALQSIETFKEPKADMEQYQTPAKIAADILWNAYNWGDIGGLKVADLACGTGILSIGSALLNACEVVGVDADPSAVDIAREEAKLRSLDDRCRFISADIRQFNEKADTVMQNPPFGAQKAHRKEADRIFITKSVRIAPVVYSFHLKETEEFVKQFFELEGANVSQCYYYQFPIPHMYDFHQKEEVEVEVVILRVVKE